MTDKPILVEVFSDNGTHSHWTLIDPKDGIKLWSEYPEECKAMGYPVKEPERVNEKLVNALKYTSEYLSKGGFGRSGCLDIVNEAISTAEQQMEKEESVNPIELLKWITDKDTMLAPMFGGTPELEKDYRFADEHNDYTVEEVIQLFKISK